jgi:predicted AlkP superfamily pyrophosphatase or phosphodiesterase
VLCGARVGGAEPSTVIVLSWDGTRHDYAQRASTPALDRMARSGVRAERLIPVFPSSTFPNHVALATGTYVDRHGIVGNVFLDRARGEYRYSKDASWIEAEPIWVAAERQGVKSAAFFWVGSETDWRGRGASYRRTPFDGELPESEKVSQILAWLDLPPAERPRLVLSWWHGCDDVGHELGPNDERIVQQLESQDAELTRLLEALDARHAWEHTTLLIVSDHGMAEVTQTLDPIEPLEARGIRARLVSGGGMGHVWLDDPTQLAAALAALAGLPHVRAYASDALPPDLRAYHADRSGHLTLITEPPYALVRTTRFEALRNRLGSWLGLVRGAHGYLPDHPDMSGVFYALGRGIPSGMTLAPVRVIDVAPTIARLLDIEPPQSSEGAALVLEPAEPRGFADAGPAEKQSGTSRAHAALEPGARAARVEQLDADSGRIVEALDHAAAGAMQGVVVPAQLDPDH